MEKISSILPSSPRVASVDLKESAPVRPGTPAFGRPEAQATLKKAKLGETAERAAGIAIEQMDWRSKDQERAAIAKGVSEKFFGSNQREAPVRLTDESAMSLRAPNMVGVASVPAGFRMDRLQSVTAPFTEKPMMTDEDMEMTRLPDIKLPPPIARESAPIAPSFGSRAGEMQPATLPHPLETGSEQPAGLYPRGSFIDLVA